MAGLPAGHAAVGGLGSGIVEGASATLVRVSADHWLALLDSGHAPEACHALLEAGRSLGLTLVGCEAVGRLAAAARPMTLLDARARPDSPGEPCGGLRPRRGGDPGVRSEAR